MLLKSTSSAPVDWARVSVRDLVVKLGGFTACRNNVSRTMSIDGIPPCMAPEILEDNGRYSDKVDIYSMGVTAFNLLCSRFPNRGEGRKFCLSCTLFFVKPFANTNVSAPVIGGNSTALDATLVVAGCSEVMKRFLRMALARDPKRRPAAKDILSDLKRFHQKKAPSVESGPNFALQEGDAFDLSGYSQAKKLGKGATADVFRYIKEGSEGVHSKIAIKHYREPGYDTIQIYIVLYM